VSVSREKVTKKDLLNSYIFIEQLGYHFFRTEEEACCYGQTVKCTDEDFCA